MITKATIDNLSVFFAKNELEKKYFPLVKRFYQSEFFTDAMREMALIKTAYDIAASKKAPNKQELSIICFSIFYNQEIFTAFIKSMPEWFGKLVEQLLWQKELHRDEVEKIAGKAIIKLTAYGDGYSYLPELNFFVMNNLYGYFFGFKMNWKETYKKKPVSFSLPQPFRSLIEKFYPAPQGYELTPIEILNHAPGEILFNAEPDILQEFGPLISYYLQGNVKYSAKGRPNAGGLKKIQRTLALKEFYDEKMNSDLHPVRTMLVMGMLHGIKSNTILDDTAASIKNLFTNHFTKNKFPAAITNFIINKVKGFNYIDEHEYEHEVAQLYWKILGDFPETGWITWQAFQRYLEVHFFELQPLKPYSFNKLYLDSDNDGYGRENISQPAGKNYIQWPFAKGILFLFAAYGLLEIVYTQPDTSVPDKIWFSEYDGLQAFRLTALGKYVLGKSKSYDPPVFDDQNKLLFDEDKLLIRVEGNINLMTTLLGNYVEKIAANRFAFRPALFLKDCKNVKQVEQKITLFRKSLNVKLPPYWNDALSKMVSNATAVVAQTNLFVFKLNEKDKNLLQTIAQDNQLKTIVIKAERFYVLVDAKDKTAFKNRLMELGYLVEV